MQHLTLLLLSTFIWKKKNEPFRLEIKAFMHISWVKSGSFTRRCDKLIFTPKGDAKNKNVNKISVHYKVII